MAKKPKGKATQEKVEKTEPKKEEKPPEEKPKAQKYYIALVDVVPEDTDVIFETLVEKLRKAVPAECTIEGYEEMDVAFGLKKARLRVRYPEEWGGTDKVEEYLKTVEGLQGVEGIAFSKAETLVRQ